MVLSILDDLLIYGESRLTFSVIHSPTSFIPRSCRASSISSRLTWEKLVMVCVDMFSMPSHVSLPLVSPDEHGEEGRASFRYLATSANALGPAVLAIQVVTDKFAGVSRNTFALRLAR
jgi:hypothetical protein